MYAQIPASNTPRFEGKAGKVRLATPSSPFGRLLPMDGDKKRDRQFQTSRPRNKRCKLTNVFPMRPGHPSESATFPHQHACAATLRNTTIIFHAVRNSKLYLRFVTIIYILYFYLAGAGVVSRLTATAAVPLSAHPLRRRFAVLTTTTLPLSN
jgi:hypothetical protein